MPFVFCAPIACYVHVQHMYAKRYRYTQDTRHNTYTANAPMIDALLILTYDMSSEWRAANAVCVCVSEWVEWRRKLRIARRELKHNVVVTDNVWIDKYCEPELYYTRITQERYTRHLMLWWISLALIYFFSFERSVAAAQLLRPLPVWPVLLRIWFHNFAFLCIAVRRILCPVLNRFLSFSTCYRSTPQQEKRLFYSRP